MIRKFTPEMAKMLKRIKLRKGKGDQPNELCVMQALAYVTGQARELNAHIDVTDSPICVSPLITSALITINDTCTDRQRSRLKALIPEIMGTRPIKTIRRGNRVFEVGDTNKTYERREKKRLDIYRADRDLLEAEDAPFSQRLRVVKEMIAVK